MQHPRQATSSIEKRLSGDAFRVSSIFKTRLNASDINGLPLT